MTERDMMGN